MPEGGIVDLAFAGEDFEFMYILTKQNLYKLEGEWEQDKGSRKKVVIS